MFIFFFIIWKKKKQKIRNERYEAFSDVRKIAEGHFGVVHRSQWKSLANPSRDVVMKVFFFKREGRMD